MSALNPLLPSGQAPEASDKRAYEPSMEDILASIRRIIADDQSLPKRSPTADQVLPETAPDATQSPATEMPTVEPTPFPLSRASFLRPTETAAPESGPQDLETQAPIGVGAQVSPFPAREPVPETAVTPTDTRGHLPPLSAPQFPTPHGPAGDEPAAEVPRVAPLSEATPPRAVPSYADAISEPSPRPAPLEQAAIDENEALYETPIEPTPSFGLRGPASTLFSAQTDSSVSSAFNVLAASRLASNSDELMTLAREMIRPLLRTWLDDNLPSMVERMVRAEIERVARGGR